VLNPRKVVLARKSVSQADWLQRYMFPQTLQHGRLSQDEADRITYTLISRCRRIEAALSSFQNRQRDVTEVALELRTETGRKYCPVCNPDACSRTAYAITTPLRVLNQTISIREHDGEDPVSISKLEHIAAAAAGEEPDLPVLCAKDSQQKIMAFRVSAESFNLYIALPLGGRKSSFMSPIPAKHIHRIQIYAEGIGARMISKGYIGQGGTITSSS